MKFASPFIIAHGLSDTVVSAKQSRALAREFRVRGVPHEPFFRKFASHGFFESEDYAAVERFLATHLAPDTGGK